MRVEVKCKGIVVGFSEDEGKTITFLNTEVAKKLQKEMNKNQTIYVSSRSIGEVNEKGYVINEQLKELVMDYTKEQIEEWKSKAEKWDALGKQIDECYTKDNSSEVDDEESEDQDDFEGDGLISIGELAAIAYGWL